MKKLLKGLNFKFMVVLLALLISQLSVWAADASIQTDKPITGGNVVLFFALLVFVIVAPAFKKSSRVVSHK